MANCICQKKWRLLQHRLYSSAPALLVFALPLLLSSFKRHKNERNNKNHNFTPWLLTSRSSSSPPFSLIMFKQQRLPLPHRKQAGAIYNHFCNSVTTIRQRGRRAGGGGWHVGGGEEEKRILGCSSRRLSSDIDDDHDDKLLASEHDVSWKNRFDIRKQYHEPGGVIVAQLGTNNPGEWKRRRNLLFEKGVYPGEEYRILSIHSLTLLKEEEEEEEEEEEAHNNNQSSTSRLHCHRRRHRKKLSSFLNLPSKIQSDDVVLTLRPNYPLVKELEREWPVEVRLSDLPLLIPRATYYRRVVLGTVLASTTLLSIGIIAPANVLSAYYVPSQSMVPTILPGDTLLVEKVSKKVRSIKRGEMIMFYPPNRLIEIERAQGVIVPSKQAFVKRIVAIPGDRVEVLKGIAYVNGQPIEEAGAREKSIAASLPTESWTIPEIVLDSNSVFVLGDNPARSVDSRCWGTLPLKNIIGRPIYRIGPFSRLGPL